MTTLAPDRLTETRGDRATGTIRVALGQYDIGWENPEASLNAAAGIVERAAAKGARVVALPEMCTAGFTMDAKTYAEPIDGRSVTRLRELATEHDLWVAAGVATREQLEDDDSAHAYNSLLLINPDGEIAGHYRKQRLFACGLEHKAYVPGHDSVVVDVEGVRTALFICYDLRFPELFRAVARETDLMLLVANWPEARSAHWDALLPARAIENQAYMIGVNRTGVGGDLRYTGRSAAYDPWGKSLGGELADVSADVVARLRKELPFLDDMRLG